MSNNPERAAKGKKAATLVLVAAALLLLLLMLRFIVAHPKGTLDFVNLYTAGRIVHEGSAAKLFDLSLQRRIEDQLAPGGQFLPFDHPPFEAWLCLPLAFLPYRQAYLLWAVFNLLVLGLVFRFLPCTGYRLGENSKLVWLAACLPIAAGALVLGQDSLLLALIFLFAFLALKKRRDVLAGLVLGVGLFRFEILIPFVFVFFLRRRWKVLLGFSLASVLALFLSLALVGWSGLVQYGKVLLEMGRTTGSAANGINVATMPSLRGALATFFGALIPSRLLFPLVVAGSLMLLLCAAWEFRSIAEPEGRAFDLQFSFAVIASLLASYHLFVHELTPLIVLAFLFLGYEDLTRRSDVLLKRSGSMLLLLFFLVMAVGGVLRFRSFSVVFVVLVGLLAWLAGEISTFQRKVRFS